MPYIYEKSSKFGIEVLKAVWNDTPIETKEEEDCGCNKAKEETPVADVQLDHVSEEEN